MGFPGGMGGFPDMGGMDFDAPRGRDRRASAAPAPETETEIGCICGFSCGTQKALDKHLARFPDDPAHAAKIVKVCPPAARRQTTAPSESFPAGLGCSCGFTCGTPAALAKHVAATGHVA